MSLADDIHAWMSAQTTPVKPSELQAALDARDDRDVALSLVEMEVKDVAGLVLLPARAWRRVGVTAFSSPPTRPENYFYATVEQYKAWARPPYSVMWISADVIGETDPDAWTRGYAFRDLTIDDSRYDIDGIYSDEWSRHFWTGHARNAADAYAQGFTSVAYDFWDRSDFEFEVEDIASCIAGVHAEFVDDDTSDPAYTDALVVHLNARRAKAQAA